MFTYEARAAMATSHQESLRAQADNARLVKLAMLGRSKARGPAAPVPVMPVERRRDDRRVAQVPVVTERRCGTDRRRLAAA